MTASAINNNNNNIYIFCDHRSACSKKKHHLDIILLPPLKCNRARHSCRVKLLNIYLCNKFSCKKKSKKKKLFSNLTLNSLHLWHNFSSWVKKETYQQQRVHLCNFLSKEMQTTKPFDVTRHEEICQRRHI